MFEVPIKRSQIYVRKRIELNAPSSKFKVQNSKFIKSLLLFVIFTNFAHYI